MQMIVSPINRAMLAHDLAGEDRTLSDLLASVMASVGFGLILRHSRPAYCLRK